MNWTLILTSIGTTATIISTIVAIRTKNEAKKTLKQIKEENSKNIKNNGNISISNSGNNSGFLNGINSGDINK